MCFKFILDLLPIKSYFAIHITDYIELLNENLLQIFLESKFKAEHGLYVSFNNSISFTNNIKNRDFESY